MIVASSLQRRVVMTPTFLSKSSSIVQLARVVHDDLGQNSNAMRRANALLARAHAAHLPGAALLDNFALSLGKSARPLPRWRPLLAPSAYGRLMALVLPGCVRVRGIAAGGAVAGVVGSAKHDYAESDSDTRACCNDCRDEGVQCQSVAQCQSPICPLPENW